MKIAAMSVAERMWDAITTVIKMNDKVERVASRAYSWHVPLTGRVISEKTAADAVAFHWVIP